MYLSFYPNKKSTIMRKALFIALLAMSPAAFGQYYYLTDSGNTPGGLNQDGAYPVGGGQLAGWTSILGPSVGTPAWSADQAIPFAFNFNGAPVTNFKVSSTGVLTFDVAAGAVPGSTPAALPNASVPNNSVCAWGLEASGANDNVSVKTFGTAPNRQHWIHFSSCTNGTIGWSYWSIVLEESTDKIYVVDQRNTTGTGALSVGIQIDGSTAYSVTGSPSLGATAGTDPTPADDFYYEFIQGVQPAYEVQLLSFDILPYIGSGNIDIQGTVKNNGANAITTLDVTWDDGSGPYNDQLNVNIAPNATYQFTHGTALNATAGQAYTIDLSATTAGDADMTNNSAQASTVSLTSIPSKTVVGEEKTGTWCGWCPRGAVALAGMEATPEFIGIAVHNGDPMTVASYDGAIGTYVPGGYPGGGVDRVIEGDPSTFAQMHAQRVNEIVPCAVNSITATLNNNQIDVSTEVEFFGNIAGNYRVSCVVIEDDVIGSGANWAQANYYDGGGSGTLTDPVTNFEWSTAGANVDPNDFGGYDHVARYLSNDDILGDAGSLPAGTVTIGTHNHSFSAIPSSVIDNVSKAHVVVMIINAATGEILNAGKTTITDPSASIEDLENTYALSVYPNPTNGNAHITFDLNAAQTVEINVTDALGNVVSAFDATQMPAGQQEVNFNASALSSGIYFVNLKVNGQVITKRLSVAK